jgi:hypothetical protein
MHCCTHVDQLFIKIEVNTDIGHHKVMRKLSIHIKGLMCTSKRGAGANGWRRKRPYFFQEGVCKDNILLVIGIEQRAESM